jgi:hypothetical protein
MNNKLTQGSRLPPPSIMRILNEASETDPGNDLQKLAWSYISQNKAVLRVIM